MKLIAPRLLLTFTLLAAFTWTDAMAQDSSRDVTKKKAKKQTSEDSSDAAWKKMPLLLDRPEKAYEVIGLVSAPQIFLWDDEESMKESLQKQAWKMKADAVVLDRVDTSFRFTGPAGGANGRAIRYKE